MEIELTDKYGFVYIWRDRKHNRYYVGSHWGTEDDGYVCSSSWMTQAYLRRPEDFKRRILKKVTTNRKDLFAEEDRYLAMMKTEELKGPRYYNIHNATHHWTQYPENIKTISEKISLKTKEAMAHPEVQEKLKLHSKKGTKSSPETIEKMRQSMIKTMAEKFPVEDREKGLPRDSEELIEVYRQKSLDMWANRTDEKKSEISQKISESLKGKKNRLGQTNSEEHRRKISEALKGKVRSEEHKVKLRKPRRKRTEEERKAQSERIKASWAKRKSGG